MLSPHIDAETFARTPAICADAQAALPGPNLDRSERNVQIVSSFLRERTGTVLAGPVSWYLERQSEGRFALVVFHRFSEPRTGEAQLVVIAERFSWNRKFLRAIGLLAIDLGIRRLLAFIPQDAEGIEHLAKRAGFVFTRAHVLHDGRPGSEWTLLPGTLLSLGRRTQQA